MRGCFESGSQLHGHFRAEPPGQLLDSQECDADSQTNCFSLQILPVSSFIPNFCFHKILFLEQYIVSPLSVLKLNAQVICFKGPLIIMAEKQKIKVINVSKLQWVQTSKTSSLWCFSAFWSCFLSYKKVGGGVLLSADFSSAGRLYYTSPLLWICIERNSSLLIVTLGQKPEQSLSREQ